MALTRTMAQELASYNIRVNGVGPGYIETELLRKVIAKDFLDEVLLDRTPLGRLGQPEEVAEAILFLLSEGSSYITGETICIDGGIICGSYYSNKKVRESFLKGK
jgi:NAD(P)-dependent dehydrogenase (short-subunit alcohol dehydrogenase family)